MKLIAALACTAALALSATGASAAVICNDEGDCWRVKENATMTLASSFASTTTIGSGRTATNTAGATRVLVTGITVAVSGSASIDSEAALLR